MRYLKYIFAEIPTTLKQTSFKKSKKKFTKSASISLQNKPHFIQLFSKYQHYFSVYVDYAFDF